MSNSIVSRISGSVVVATDVEEAQMYDVVRIGELGLLGEIIRLEGNKATIQVYEDTTGIRPGEKLINTKKPLSMQLGPGLLKSIYDGIQRPLDVLREKSGDFISRGNIIPALDQ
ncbi:MAG: V-type ATP synthase subunit A, partial [Nitrososphaeraceae archaeon]|nr:V-type ATP synthase subunit A [Nitrososphaeraceae archaeon]